MKKWGFFQGGCRLFANFCQKVDFSSVCPLKLKNSIAVGPRGGARGGVPPLWGVFWGQKSTFFGGPGTPPGGPPGTPSGGVLGVQNRHFWSKNDQKSTKNDEKWTKIDQF